jgi:hypothetical protein
VTLTFTHLEAAALEAIAGRYPEAREALKAQLATATVSERENTGVGFFTSLAVDRSTKAIESTDKVLGPVWADIEGFGQPLILLLFTSDGYARTLEGATVLDSTVGLELADLRFEIIPDVATVLSDF